MSLKEQELVAAYNKSPNSLISKVVKVSVKQDSITAINRNSIILASIGNGNYWVIHDTDINYWLLPKAKLKVEQYRREIVELLFDCDDYEPEYYSFELNKPAQVSILANKHEWKLEKRGVLKFINSLNTDSSQQENNFETQLKNSNDRLLESESFINPNAYLEVSIERLVEQISQIENKLQVIQNSQQSLNYPKNTSISTNLYLEAVVNRLSERVSQLEDKLEITQYLETIVNKFSDQINELEDKLKTIPSNQQSIISYNQPRNIALNCNSSGQTTNLSKSDITQTIANAYIELVNTYNNNPKLLEQRAIKVSEPTDSINRRHTDSSQKIVLKQTNNSNYWVLHDDISTNVWLLPKVKLRIDKFRYETTKALFECHGYQPEHYSFKLVKPAKVIPLSTDEQTWELEEPGILEFTIET